LEQREQRIRQREAELAEQRRVLAEEYRLLRAQRTTAPALAMDGLHVPGRFETGRDEGVWARLKRFMLGASPS
jgi:hypothetical protein